MTRLVLSPSEMNDLDTFGGHTGLLNPDVGSRRDSSCPRQGLRVGSGRCICGGTQAMTDYVRSKTIHNGSQEFTIFMI